MTASGRVLRALALAAAAWAVADAVAVTLLREPRRAPDHRLGAAGAGPATRPPDPGSPR